jgi:hypothetical protein
MKQWDVFISHASEDKESAALPLALALRQAGVHVWLDRFELKLGDSLREKIDEGLANSRYGVVILSPRFFSKKWTRAELDGLFARDVVLPIWLDLTGDEVLRISPMLAGKLAAKMEDGVSQVAEQIIDRLFSVGDVTGEASSWPRKFAQLLALVSSCEIYELLSQNRSLLAVALGVDGVDYLREGVALGGLSVHVCAAKFQPTTGMYDNWKLVFLGEPTDLLFSENGIETEHVRDLLTKVERLRSWIGSNLREARAVLPDIKSSFNAIVVVGRRPQPKSATTERLAELNDSLFGTHIRTYDWLLDIALQVSH